MKAMSAIRVALALAAWVLLTGCEWGGRNNREADFANTSPTAVDVYRNGDLQFTLAPGADGTAHLDRTDTYAVLDHATGEVRGTHTVDVSGDVINIRVTAVIYADHVDWSTEVDAG